MTGSEYPWASYSMAFRTSMQALEQDTWGREMLRQARGAWGKVAGVEDRLRRVLATHVPRGTEEA